MQSKLFIDYSYLNESANYFIHPLNYYLYLPNGWSCLLLVRRNVIDIKVLSPHIVVVSLQDHFAVNSTFLKHFSFYTNSIVFFPMIIIFYSISRVKIQNFSMNILLCVLQFISYFMFNF